MLPPADILSFVILSFGSISSIVLSKLLLKFYSTILFADTNIFTHLNRAAVVAIQVLVQTRVTGAPLKEKPCMPKFTRLFLG